MDQSSSLPPIPVCALWMCNKNRMRSREMGRSPYHIHDFVLCGRMSTAEERNCYMYCGVHRTTSTKPKLNWKKYMFHMEERSTTLITVSLFWYVCEPYDPKTPLGFIAMHECQFPNEQFLFFPSLSVAVTDTSCRLRCPVDDDGEANRKMWMKATKIQSNEFHFIFNWFDLSFYIFSSSWSSSNV